MIRDARAVRWLGFRQDFSRPSEGEKADRVGYIELFFDLVFVYAVTALTAVLIDEQSIEALALTAVLGTAIWWTWISTSWVTNWLDPDRGAVRGLLVALLAASIVLSGTVGHVLEGEAAPFAVTLVAMNLGRSVFTVLALRKHRPADAANFINLSIWTMASAPVWVGGAFTDAPLTWWALALAVDLSGPLVRYAVPGMGRTQLHAWRIRGGHLAERVSLFVLIALGESIALVGEHISGALPHPAALVSLGAALTHTVLLWFLFFDRTESLGTRRIRSTQQTGAIARNTYTYTAALLVLGIVLSAAATDLAYEESSDGETTAWAAGLLVGANVLCLAGNLLFRLSLRNAPLRTHLSGILATMALFPLRTVIAPLPFEWLVVLVLAAVVGADAAAARRREVRR